MSNIGNIASWVKKVSSKKHWRGVINRFQFQYRQLRNSPELAFEYIVGTTRYFCYTHGLSFLIRPSVVNIYRHRIIWASPCVAKGECICCGCKTPDLMFAPKGCSSEEMPHCWFSEDNPRVPCYGPMKISWFGKALKWTLIFLFKRR